MTANTHPAYRPDIDGLRAVAVLAVIAYHANGRLAPGGFAGVDVFFVISGFLISSIIVKNIEQGAFSFADFYARRIVRIFPALLAVLASVLAVGWFILLPDAYAQLGRHIASGVGFVSNIAFWRESGYFDKAAEQKPLLHLWSLGVEEQFYLIWPGLLVLCSNIGLNLLVAIFTVAAGSFILNVMTVHTSPAAVFYLPVTRLWELLLGSALAYASVSTSVASGDAVSRVVSRYRSRGARVRDAESILGSLMLVASFVEVNRLRAFPGWWALLPTGGASLLISAGAHAWINRLALGQRPLVFLGLISYPLYLWHWPLLSFVRILSVGDPPPSWRAGAVATAFVLAWTTYRFLELPIRSTSVQRGRLVMTLLSSLGVVAMVGVWTDAMGGVPQRFAAELQPITNFKYNYGAAYREGRCFLMIAQTYEAFGEECVDAERTASAPLLVLWGDSHAAHLYPGLRRLQQDVDFRVAQFTSSGCPPLLGAATPARPACPGINASVIARIARMRPQTVVLAAWWVSYDHRFLLRDTVSALKQKGVSRIVLIGPVPNWSHPLPEILVNAFERDPFHHIPNRIAFGLLQSVAHVDEELQSTAAALGIVYISAVGVLCNQNGCLARLGSGSDDLTAWDATHFTAAGSEYFIRTAAPRLFEAQPTAVKTQR